MRKLLAVGVTGLLLVSLAACTLAQTECEDKGGTYIYQGETPVVVLMPAGKGILVPITQMRSIYECEGAGE